MGDGERGSGANSAAIDHISLTGGPAATPDGFTISNTAYYDLGRTASTSFRFGGPGSGSPTTTTLHASPDPSTVGRSVTFTSSVTPPPAGTVTFHEGAVVIGTAKVAGGAARFTARWLPAGPNRVIAVYNGDATHKGSASNLLTQRVRGTNGVVVGAGGALHWFSLGLGVHTTRGHRRAVVAGRKPRATRYRPSPQRQRRLHPRRGRRTPLVLTRHHAQTATRHRRAHLADRKPRATQPRAPPQRHRRLHPRRGWRTPLVLPRHRRQTATRHRRAHLAARNRRARGIALLPNGTGGFILGAGGALHWFSLATAHKAPRVVGAPTWPRGTDGRAASRSSPTASAVTSSAPAARCTGCRWAPTTSGPRSSARPRGRAEPTARAASPSEPTDYGPSAAAMRAASRSSSGLSSSGSGLGSPAASCR